MATSPPRRQGCHKAISTSKSLSAPISGNNSKMHLSRGARLLLESISGIPLYYIYIILYVRASIDGTILRASIIDPATTCCNVQNTFNVPAAGTRYRRYTNRSANAPRRGRPDRVYMWFDHAQTPSPTRTGASQQCSSNRKTLRRLRPPGTC